MPLIINCDDFGMHPTVDDGILEILEQGAVSSCSIMPTGNSFGEAVSRFRAIGGTALGVHLALTGEYSRLPTRPVLPRAVVPSLADSSGFLYRDVEIVRDSAAAREIRAELRAQVESVLARGLTITHLDGHCFFYEPEEGGEEMYRIAHDLAREYDVPLRCSSVPEDGMMKATRLVWQEYDDVESRRRRYEELLRSETEFPCELIIHPAKDLEKLRTFTAAGLRRVADYEFFVSADWREILKERNIRVLSWREARAFLNLTAPCVA